MKCHSLLLTAAAVLVLATGVSARDRNADGPHVRALNAASGGLMADAQQKSATVRELFTKLEASNLVTYVRIVPVEDGTPESGLSFVGSSKVRRYVLVSISGSATADRQIELLGHELQHAVEVAGLPWVQNDGQFQDMMRIMGWRDASAARGYETAAANLTENRIRREVHPTGNSR
jgi:hypothetical protein